MDLKEKYLPILHHLSLQNMVVGLHFWGVLANGVVPSFAVADATIRNRTMEMIKQCIHIAAENSLSYVVIHASPRKVCYMSLVSGRLEVTDIETPAPISRDLFLANAVSLHDYAHRQGIKLVVETETRRKPEISFNETEYGNIVDACDQDIRTLASLGRAGVALCVDFAHLATWYAEPSRPRDEMLHAMLEYLRSVRPHVHLIHVASVQPPFLIDTTNGLTEEEIALGVFPNRNETLALLKAVIQKDLVVIPEPRMADHVYHNKLLRDMLEEIR